MSTKLSKNIQTAIDDIIYFRDRENGTSTEIAIIHALNEIEEEYQKSIKGRYDFAYVEFVEYHQYIYDEYSEAYVNFVCNRDKYTPFERFIVIIDRREICIMKDALDQLGIPYKDKYQKRTT
jgi:hypothetical protein